MKRYIVAIRILFATLFVFFSSYSYADEAVSGLVLSEVTVNQADMASVKRGATFFASNCMSCHTLIYLRYNKLAKEMGITYDKMPINITNWPNGVKPPDLSLEASMRGPDWIYTYLHSFYQDSTKPTGSNNLLVPGTAMPNIVAPYQGTQVLVKDPTFDLWGHVRWYNMLELTTKGTMSPEDFDATITDVVNFLSYAAAPYKVEQEYIGKWVLAFLVVLFVFAYLLKRNYWQDVKKKRK